jgi:tripartite-type tricarboxylate transporter receptor subunit TctC
MSPTSWKSLPYDPTQSVRAGGAVAEFPNVLVIGPSVKANSLKELIALAKATPGS